MLSSNTPTMLRMERAAGPCLIRSVPVSTEINSRVSFKTPS